MSFNSGDVFGEEPLCVVIQMEMATPCLSAIQPCQTLILQTVYRLPRHHSVAYDSIYAALCSVSNETMEVDTQNCLPDFVWEHPIPEHGHDPEPIT